MWAAAMKLAILIALFASGFTRNVPSSQPTTLAAANENYQRAMAAARRAMAMSQNIKNQARGLPLVPIEPEAPPKPLPAPVEIQMDQTEETVDAQDPQDVDSDGVAELLPAEAIEAAEQQLQNEQDGMGMLIATGSQVSNSVHLSSAVVRMEQKSAAATRLFQGLTAKADHAEDRVGKIIAVARGEVALRVPLKSILTTPPPAYVPDAYPVLLELQHGENKETEVKETEARKANAEEKVEAASDAQAQLEAEADAFLGVNSTLISSAEKMLSKASAKALAAAAKAQKLAAEVGQNSAVGAKQAAKVDAEWTEKMLHQVEREKFAELLDSAETEAEEPAEDAESAEIEEADSTIAEEEAEADSVESDADAEGDVLAATEVSEEESQDA